MHQKQKVSESQEEFKKQKPVVHQQQDMYQHLQRYQQQPEKQIPQKEGFLQLDSDFGRKEDFKKVKEDSKEQPDFQADRSSLRQGSSLNKSKVIQLNRSFKAISTSQSI